MELKPTPTPVHTTFGLVSLSTNRTLLRAVPLILQYHSHPQPLSFVGDEMPDLTMQHLVDLLIRLFVVVGRHPDIPKVANHNCLHASLVERGDQSGRLLVQNVLDLVV
jgi:hypothetical protein